MNNDGFWNEAAKVNTTIDSMQTDLRLGGLKSQLSSTAVVAKLTSQFPLILWW